MPFASVQKAAPDPVQEVNKKVFADSNPRKVDLNQGVYRNEDGVYHEFRVLRKAKEILYQRNPDHDYNPTTGIPSFCTAAAELLFGKGSELIAERRIATAQTIAGTGANRIAAAFLHRHLRLPESNNSLPSVYIGEPAWGNYRPLFAAAGFTVESYQHCLPKATSLSLDNILAAAEHAPRGSIFVLQGCCHNPTGLDYTPAQWRAIVEKMLVKGHFAFFDIAYQGFGSSSATALDDDAFAVRYFAENGIPMLAAQSFSKNFGLYGERLGAVHVLCETAGIAENVLDQIRVQLRWEVSSTPAYPARLVDIILSDPDLSREWRVELSKAAGRIQSLREGLHQSLIANDGSPEQWEHVLAEKGLFCLTGLSKAQTDVIAREHSVYMAPNGRINVAGLSKGNLEYTAKAICEVLGMGQVATPPGED